MLWEEAIKIFVFGFLSVFVALAVLVITISILGSVVKIFK